MPCFDPSSVPEAYQMVQDAFALSEELGTPVFLRPTTRIDHAYQAFDVADEADWPFHEVGGFVRDSSRWVIFPRLSVANHAKIERRNAELSERFSAYRGNFVVPETGSCP